MAVTSNKSRESRLERVRAAIALARADAFIVTDTLNIAYVSGFVGTAAHLLISSSEAILITDSRYTLAAAQEAPEFTVVLCAGSGGYAERLASVVAERPALQTVAFEKNNVTYGQWQTWCGLFPESAVLTPAADLIETLRQIKDAGEIAAIRWAVTVAENAFLDVKELLVAGTTEADYALALETAMRKRGAQDVAFPTIVASGPQGARPHHHSNDRTFTNGDLVTVDWGAKRDGYCSDITRTVLIGPLSVATEKQELIHRLVLEAKRRAIAAIAPGKTGKSIDAIARAYLTDYGFGDAFSHSLGHALGLDVHDGPGFSTRSELVLEPGMVLTVEPGIYLERWGGVRLEEDVVVTEFGCEVLTSLPNSLTI